MISTLKTTYSYSAWPDLSIGALFDIIRKKYFLANFHGKGVQKKSNNFFFEYGQITHQSIDLAKLSKNMLFFEVLYINHPKFLENFWSILDFSVKS
jgi:hypothetical protein